MDLHSLFQLPPHAPEWLPAVRLEPAACGDHSACGMPDKAVLLRLLTYRNMWLLKRATVSASMNTPENHHDGNPFTASSDRFSYWFTPLM